MALSNAWQTGAQQLGEQRREDFANDPLNLLAVQGSANAQKGAGDAATWLPRAGFRCEYAARQIAVKQRYDLWVTPPEHDALTRILGACPGQPLPTSAGTGVPPRGGAAAGPEPEPEPATTAPPAPLPGAGQTPFDNCTAACAAGGAPVRVGDPGYGTHLDRDGDGVGCE